MSIRMVLPLFLVACNVSQRQVQVRPAAFDERGVSPMAFVSSAAQGMSDMDGKPCRGYGGHRQDGLIGWQGSPTAPACQHDTWYDGQQAGSLELHWQVPVPKDGDYDVVASGYSVGGLGMVVARGSWFGDYWAKAWLSVDASSPHCSATWSMQLACADISLPSVRAAKFSGWTELPTLVLTGCKAQDRVDVRLRIWGDSNRGVIEVDWFGFSAVDDDEVNHIFGLRPHPPGAPQAVAPGRATSPAAVHGCPRS